jgi:hypothetical protein
MGTDTLIHLEAGGLAILGRVLGFAEFKAGDEIRFNVPPSKIHLFDADTGTRIGLVERR